MKILLNFLLILTIWGTNAQNKYAKARVAVQGTVLEKTTQNTIPYASVVVISKGKNITGAITKENGYFSIKDIPLKPFTVRIEFIGYKKWEKKINASINTPILDLGTIFLETQTTELQEVELVAERSSIIQKIDRKVINVGKDLTSAGSSASEIMSNIPSVNVDSQSGAISLRGNDNVRILIDGKPTNIEASELLKQIPSTSIKTIELITNPSAKYNPEGMSGIINIVLHKGIKKGFNGTLNSNLNVAKNARLNTSLDLNYRVGKFNIYASINNRVGKKNQLGKVERKASSTDNTQWTQHFDALNNRKSDLYKIGVDYYLNDKNTLSFYTNQRINDLKENNENKIDPLDGSVFMIQNATTDKQIQDQTYNVAYTRDFKKQGHRLQIEGNFGFFDLDETIAFTNTQRPFYQDAEQKTRNSTIINIDYENPITETAKLEIGAELRIRNTDNAYTTSSTTANNADFYYDRNIQSLYATYGDKKGKWGYQLGARIENFKVDARFSMANTDAATYNMDEFNIYPSAFVSYTPDDTNTHQISLSRRVDRPGLRQISPIRDWSTPLLTAQGNPGLRQEFSNSIEYNYTKKLPKGSISAGIFYRSITDEINRSLSLDPLSTSGAERYILSYANFGSNKAYGFEFSANYRVNSWWNFNASFDLNSSKDKGVVDNQNVSVQNTGYNFRMQNNFSVSKKLRFSLFGFYRGPRKSLQFEPKEMFFINTGARYNFLKNKATLSLNYNDILNSMRFAFYGTRPYVQHGMFTWESSTINLGLSYRFGSGKYRALSRKKRENNTKDGGGGF